jgi:cob(I)alamin adenosyltransferase
MKIYTKTGDNGTTGLIGGTRVKKTDARLEAYGTVDELNSFVGLLLTNDLPDSTKNTLYTIQNKLFVIGSFLATDIEKTSINLISLLTETDVIMLENEIDTMNEMLPELRNFILPGGNPASALAHICRTITRRAERKIQAVTDNYQQVEHLSEYVNRLSDYFFVLARFINLTFKTKEIYWKK